MGLTVEGQVPWDDDPSPTDSDAVRVPSRASGPPTGVARDGTRSTPLSSQLGEAPSDPVVVASPGDPLPNAESFLDAVYGARDGQRLVVCYGGGLFAWDGTCWTSMEEGAVRAGLYRYFRHALYETDDGPPKRFEPNRRKVADLLDALRSITFLPRTVAAPSWLSPRDLPADEVVACANGLLHWPARELYEHTPAYFAHHAVPFPYQPDAPAPARWQRFLQEVWADDPESVSALQEIFGYLISGATELQKILLLVGPKRSGKGTIARVLTGLLGVHHVAGPTLSGLATNFGLQPLIGKPVAIVSDARLRSGHEVLVERLLSVSGEDTLTVDRKYQEPWTGRLPTRFLILTNELPRLADTSGALSSRFVVLTMQRSFYGHEDTGLTQDLLAELPAILNWSLDGLARLRDRGRFAEPESSADAVRELEDLASPIGAFVRERCALGPEHTVRAEELYLAWRGWCDHAGRDHPGTVQTFGRDLRATVTGLRIEQPRTGRDGSRERHYAGISLTRSAP